MTQTFYGCASITDSKRIEIRNQDWSRGPASYKPKMEDSSKIPKWTLKPKIQHGGCFTSSYKNKNPGPADYKTDGKQESIDNTLQTNLKTHNSIINRSIKLQKEKELKRKQKEQATKVYEKMLKKSAMEQQMIKKQNKQNQNSKDLNIGKSFGYRDDIGHVFKVKQTSPGPVYNVGKDILKRSGNSWGSTYLKNKQKILRESEKNMPGPGAYQQNYNNNTASGWTIGKSKRNELQKSCTNQNLGPNNYSPKLLGSIKNCTIKGRHSNQTFQDKYFPAPGAYQIADTKSQKGAIFNQSPRVKIHKNLADSPSPFSYHPNSSTLNTKSCSIGQKLEIYENRLQNPGPGTYQVDEVDGQLTSEFKSNFKKLPGGYMGRKKNEKKKLCRSQDNFYRYNPNINYVSHQYPNFSFRQATYEFKRQQYENIGPGSYDNSDPSLNEHKKGKGQSYTIPKNPRFKPIVKQSVPEIGATLNKKQKPYNTFGYMPQYLLKSKKRQDKILAESQINRNQSSKNKL